MPEQPTLVIGDVHGHVDRLRALLVQEGVIDTDGKRVREDVRVVQLGDLGHFGSEFTADEDCYRHALEDHWIDTVLWGNHDRAVIDERQHLFGGYRRPIGPVTHYMHQLVDEGRYKFAAHAHGYLLTHAGLHCYWDRFVPATVEDTVELLNHPHRDGDVPHVHWRIVNAVCPLRGAWDEEAGGILWRDYDAAMSSKFHQVFGHSAQRDGLVKQLTEDSDGREVPESYCVDIGGKSEARLAGIWLPERRLVRVDL